jgi:hypothetical protein
MYRLPLRIPLDETTDSSLSWPKTSDISFLNRRALWAVSNSTSMIIFPAAICNPPANLSNADTSAFRQQGLVIESLLSSSLTASVIAI